MECIQPVMDFFLHLETTLNQWTTSLGGWFYVLLFFIVFCETGLVVMPFLPGDSLLFAVGTLASIENSPLNLPLMAAVLAMGSILGDTVNYSVGWKLGPRLFQGEDSRFLNKKHLHSAHEFYRRHGGKTVILGRFIAIVRTFAPFVAGMAKMTYPRFAFFSILGGIAWVGSLTSAGYYFGQVPFVKTHFETVVLAIVMISVLPALIGFLHAKYKARRPTIQTMEPRLASRGGKVPELGEMDIS